MSKVIPWDKSWIMRMVFLDTYNGKTDRSQQFFKENKILSDDLIACRDAIFGHYASFEKIPVGESATLYRFLDYMTYHNSLTQRPVASGTLLTRSISAAKNVHDLSQEEMLKLDGGTSQWASIKALCGDTHKVKRPPPKLKLTYEAIDHWHKRKGNWIPKRDVNIQNQYETYLHLKNMGSPSFKVDDAEKFCFGYAFGYINTTQGQSNFPNLANHESNRLISMPEAIGQATLKQSITSQDHRVIQALVMWRNINKRSLHLDIQHPLCVNKSWPEFWYAVNQ